MLPTSTLPQASDSHGPHPTFEQAVLASLERCALFLIPHLSYEQEEQLCKALWGIRHALGLPAPRHPLLDLRDWPADDAAGEALGTLLKRLDELEHPLSALISQLERDRGPHE